MSWSRATSPRPNYRTQTSRHPPFTLASLLVPTWNPFSRESLQTCRPRLGFRVYNYSLRTSSAYFTPFFVHSSFPSRDSAGLFHRENTPLPCPFALVSRLHSLLARQVENPNEILKVWDLIFSPFTLLCLQLQLHEIIAARLATASLTWHDIYICKWIEKYE